MLVGKFLNRKRNRRFNYINDHFLELVFITLYVLFIIIYLMFKWL